MKKALIATVLALPIYAQAGGFAGLDYISSKIEPDNTTATAKPEALQFKFGSWINKDETLGGELRLGLGVGDDELSNGVDVEIDRYYGAYFRGQFPNTLPVRPYGLIGVSYIETTANFPGGGSDGENYKDLSLGLGADITITNQIFLSVETCARWIVVAMRCRISALVSTVGFEKETLNANSITVISKSYFEILI